MSLFKEFRPVSVHDLLCIESSTGYKTYYKIVNIDLGAEGQESVIGLFCINKTHMNAPIMEVPFVIIEEGIKNGILKHYFSNHEEDNQ